MAPVQTIKMSNFRWVICALLFLATTINYMDRQVLSLTWKDFIAPEFHWTDGDYGTITGMFSLFYAIANLFAGKFIDWMGTKKGYLIAIFVWSLGAVLHAGCGWVAMTVEGYDSVAQLGQLTGDAAVLLLPLSPCWPVPGVGRWHSSSSVASASSGWACGCGFMRSPVTTSA